MTMRRLVLFRHSKAAAGNPDVDRPLADRGFGDAAAAGQWLTAHQVLPDLVAVSPALRTRQTWHAAAAMIASTPQLAIDERIYDNTIDDLLVVIRCTPAGISTLVLVGHSPSIGELAFTLDDGAGDSEASEAIARSYPTSGIAVFSVAAEWANVGAGGATLISFAAPRA
ncbi:MAG TPA: histidine phosphatase family protein [Mycobacteriales bacterium]|jgi:phosphohistidine phosphatase|nr:histidine phosphatase family protein [Mycobacteriales bacterium]